MRKLLILDEPNSDSDSQSSAENDRSPCSSLYFLVAAVNVLEARFVEMEPRTLYYTDSLTFGDELYRLLPQPKCFFLWIQGNVIFYLQRVGSNSLSLQSSP